MFGRSIRVARVAGIPVGITPWWLVVVGFFTWMLGSTYFPEAVHGIAPATSYALGLASVLLLFASLLAHELGHAIVARRHGVEVEEIDLWLLGGVSKMRGEAHEPGVELRYALAGPAVSALITACFGALVLALPSSVPASVLALIEYEFIINALILGFNLMPAFPLDGGRVLRALLWRRTGAMQGATEIAAGVGRAFGYVLVGLGLLLVLSAYSYDGLWLVFIGFFIVMAARQQAAGAEIRAVFAGRRAAELMTHPVVSVPDQAAVDLVAQEYFGRYPFTAFPVVDARGRARGLITIDRVRQAALGTRSGASRATALAQSVGDLVEDDPGLLVGESTDVAVLLERAPFARVGRAVVVDVTGAPVGMISITDVQRAVRSARLGSAGAKRLRG